jgi:hypothetical protein
MKGLHTDSCAFLWGLTDTHHVQVCSEINKPDGQYVLPNDRGAVMSFVSTLPVRKVRLICLYRLGQPRNDKQAEGGLNFGAGVSQMVWGAAGGRREPDEGCYGSSRAYTSRHRSHQSVALASLRSTPKALSTGDVRAYSLA